MITIFQLLMAGVLCTGHPLAYADEPETPYVVTTTENHPWVDRTGEQPADSAVSTELILDLWHEFLGVPDAHRSQ